MKIRCIAVDDEPLALEKILEYISRVPYLEPLGGFDNAVSALDYMKNHKVDLVFLDIQMEELTGIQMLEIMKDPPRVVLTTAYSEYAIKSYELDVSDYLLKPISFSRFLKACEKVSVQFNQFSFKQVPVSPSTASPENSFIYVQSGQKMQKVKFEDIYFIEGVKDYVRIRTKEEKIMTLLSFKKLETLLPAPRFLRVHKSYLIAIDKISSIERNRAEILGEQIPIGKSYQREFFEIIMKYKIN